MNQPSECVGCATPTTLRCDCGDAVCEDCQHKHDRKHDEAKHPHDMLCCLCLVELDQCLDDDCTETNHHPVDELYCDNCTRDEMDRDEEYKLKTEHAEAARVIEALLTWANQLGGWEAPCWKDATKLHAQMTGRRIDV